MIRDIVAIGDKLELRRLNSEDKTSGRGKVYVSQLLDLVDNDKAIIAMPIEKSHIVPLSVGEKYTISFYTGKGLYQCNGLSKYMFWKFSLYLRLKKIKEDNIFD